MDWLLTDDVRWPAIDGHYADEDLVGDIAFIGRDPQDPVRMFFDIGCKCHATRDSFHGVMGRQQRWYQFPLVSLGHIVHIPNSFLPLPATVLFSDEYHIRWGPLGLVGVCEL